MHIKTLLKKYYNFFYERFTSQNRSEFMWFASGYVINFVMGFVIIKILSNLGPDDYGKYALIITIANFFSLSFFGPFTQAFNRFFYTYTENKAFQNFIQLVYRMFLYTASVIIILTIISVFFSNTFSLPASLVILTGLFIITFKINESTLSLLNIIRKRKLNSLLLILEKVLITISLAVLLFSRDLDLIKALIVFNIFYFAFAVFKTLFFKKNIPVKIENQTDYPKKHIKKEFYNYVYPFMVWGQTSWLQLNGEKWIIADMLSTSDVGIYAVMISLINALISIPGNYLSEFLTPIIFKNFSDLSDKESLDTGMNYIKINIMIVTALTLFITVITYFIGSNLIVLISNKSFAAYSYLLPLLSIGVGLFNIAQAMTILGLSFNKPKIYLAPKITIGLFSLASNILLVLWFGINGIAYSSILVGAGYILLTAHANKTKLITGK